MFYVRDGKWGIFSKKISYKSKNTAYDNDEETYLNNPEYTDVVVSNISLTPEQLERLDLIRNANNVSMGAIEEYVLHGDASYEGSNEVDRVVKENMTKKKLESLIDWSNLGEKDIEELLKDYERWEPKQTYVNGKILRFGNQLYTVIAPNYVISQEGHEPDKVLALYATKGVPGTVKEYEQRDGSNPYMTGDVVKFKGETYTCTKDNTSYSPEEYPSAWQIHLIEGAIEEWVQKGYNTGAKVRFKGVVYENILVGKLNVWSPEGYPQGWEKI